jgi:hypothetical protein
VRYNDSAGLPRTKFFDRKADADAWDAQARTGAAPEVSLDQSERRTTFREYAERWRRTRQISQSLDYQRHLESRLRNHHYPHFGDRPIRAITVTDILEWLAKLLNDRAAQSSVGTYFAVLNVVMNAAVIDKAIPDNPCRAIRISAILRGLSRAPKWVPTTDDVLALVQVVPDRFKAAIWLGAGEGMRLGEVLATEAGPRCVDRPTARCTWCSSSASIAPRTAASTSPHPSPARSVTSTSTTRPPSYSPNTSSTTRP